MLCLQWAAQTEPIWPETIQMETIWMETIWMETIWMEANCMEANGQMEGSSSSDDYTMGCRSPAYTV